MVANDSRMLAFQLNDVVVSLASGMNPAMVLLQQGSQITQMGLRNVGNAALSMARAFGPAIAIAAALAVGIGAMTTEINRNQKVQVGWTDVVVASWQLVSEAIVKAFQPVIDTLGGWWNYVSPMIAQGMNNTIGTFVFGYTAIRDTWALLPAAMGDIVLQSVNNVISGVQGMINSSINLINDNLIKPIQDALGAIGVQIGTIGKVDFGGGVENPFAGAASKVGGIIGADASAAYGTNYLAAIGDRARAIVLANQQAEDSAKGLGKALGGPLSLGLDKVAEKTNAWVEAATSAFSNLGTTIIQAFTKGGNVVNNLLDALGQKLGAFGENLANSGFNALLNMGLKALTSAFMPGGGSSFVGTGFGSYGLYANGGVFSGAPGLSAYSNTIVSQPTIFPFAKGTGLMGEAGPEAIMPLRRGPDGKLGVAAANGNGGGDVHVHFHNVSEKDIPAMREFGRNEFARYKAKADRHPHRATL